MYHLDEDVLERDGFLDTIYDMLKGPDTAVVVNCILVLNELVVKGPNRGMAINRETTATDNDDGIRFFMKSGQKSH